MDVIEKEKKDRVWVNNFLFTTSVQFNLIVIEYQEDASFSTSLISNLSNSGQIQLVLLSDQFMYYNNNII